ncbi:uncharacterized protein LOC123876070 isoform X2 [Maniola jurtina]|nr:uncharacterized protein LOC123876070 isoform X2 [Maniola jurtina]
MGNYKILNIVCVAVLSFHIRGSQSRSLNDDESGHSISKKNIGDWITDCYCFPISVKGTYVSEFLPSNDEQERLVVYLYKNKKTDELTSYIPNWKKQSVFPDLTFDIGDTLQTIAADGVISLFDIAKPEGLEETTVANVQLEIPSVPTSDNQHKNDNDASSQGLNLITEEEIPSEELTVPTVSSNSDDKITTGVTMNPDQNLLLGNKQLPLNDTFTIPERNFTLLELQNQEAPDIGNGLFSHDLPEKLGTEGQTIITNEPNQMLTPLFNDTFTIPERNYTLSELQNQQMPDIVNGLFSHDLPGKLVTEGQTIITNEPNQMLTPLLNDTFTIPERNYTLSELQNQQMPDIVNGLFSHVLPEKLGTEGQTIITNEPNQMLTPLFNDTFTIPERNYTLLELQNQQMPDIVNGLFSHVLPEKLGTEGQTIITNEPNQMLTPLFNDTFTIPERNYTLLELQNQQMPDIVNGLFSHVLPEKLGTEGQTIITNEPNQMLTPLSNDTFTIPERNFTLLELQNQQMPDIVNGLFSHVLPEKLGTEGQTIITNEPNQILTPQVIQNQQTLLIPDSLTANLIPAKPGAADEITIINSPEYHSQIPNKIENQELNPPLSQQNSEKLTVPTVSPDNDSKITTSVNINPNLSLSLGNKQKPLKGTTVTVQLNQNLKPSEIQNQQAPVTVDGLFANRLPGKLESAGNTIIMNSPEQYIQIPNKIKYLELNPPSGQQNQLMGEKSHVSNNLVDEVGYVPSEYKTPIFNNWFNKQVLNIRSQRPSISDAINLQALKLKPLLIKALYENGIHPTKNGDLYDSNGNILKMANLKLRPILLGDPIEFEKLIATKKCIIPYDLPFLEAILLTLIYPPRILAIIPLDLKNVFIDTVPGTSKMCGQSGCDSNKSSHSDFSVNEENALDTNDNIRKDDVDLYTAEKTLEHRDPIYPNNKESKDAYPYVGAINDPPVRLSPKPKYDDQYSFQLTIPNGRRMPGKKFMYVNNFTPKASKNKKTNKQEETSLKRAFNVNKANGENNEEALTAEEFDGTIGKYEPIYMNNMASKYDTRNSLLQTRVPNNRKIYGRKPKLLRTRPIPAREIIYLDEDGNIKGRKAIEDFDDSQETPAKFDEEDYEDMLHIKIIGGNPATSSGTPVSSRGR